MSPFSAVPMLVAGLVASIALVGDLRSRRIPNWLTGSALLLGLLGTIALGMLGDGAAGVLWGGLTSLGGALLGFGLLLPLYVKRVSGGGRAIGAGDVKLLAALGAIVGPHVLVSIAIYGAMAGGLQALYMLMRLQPVGMLVHETLVMRVAPSLSGAKAPYALPIAAGVFLSMVLPPALGF